MSFFEERRFRLYRILMVNIGLWPYDDSGFRTFRRAVVTTFVTSFIVVQVLRTITTKYDLDPLFEIVPILVSCVLATMKYVTYWTNDKIVKRLLDQIEDDWYLVESKEELNILERSIDKANRCSVFYISCIYSAFSAYILIPFLPLFLDVFVPLNESRPIYHPFLAEYFVDEQKYFYPILLHMYAMCFTLMIIAISTDCVFIMIVSHACGMFYVIAYRLEHICDGEVCVSDKGHLSHLRLIRTVQYHQRAIEYVAVVNACFSVSFVIQLFLAVVSITAVLLQLFQTQSIHKEIMFSAYAAGFSVLMFLNIFPGQELLTHSNELFRKTYSGCWYHAPLETQKLLLIIMMRSMEPCPIVLASFFVSSYELFISIIRTSFSYFTVLYSMR